MSEQLDLVSLCHRKPVDVNHLGYICEECGLNPCEAIRPPKSKPFDPDRSTWTRKVDNSPRGKQ